jgi:hypothetical protein
VKRDKKRLHFPSYFYFPIHGSTNFEIVLHMQNKRLYNNKATKKSSAIFALLLALSSTRRRRNEREPWRKKVARTRMKDITKGWHVIIAQPRFAANKHEKCTLSNNNNNNNNNKNTTLHQQNNPSALQLRK